MSTDGYAFHPFFSQVIVYVMFAVIFDIDLVPFTGTLPILWLIEHVLYPVASHDSSVDPP